MQGRSLAHDDLESVGFDWSKLRSVKPREIAIRFGFGGLVALIAGTLGLAAGPKVGGLFLAFPAILPASLTLIEKKEGLTKAWSDASGGLLGSVGMAGFAVTAMVLLPWNPIAALLLALLAWIIISTGLYFLLRVSGLFLKQDRLFARPD
jgi:Protein of unknown function (DUF3147)